MSRLPIRARITVVFAAAMALLLGATGLFVYLRLGAELDASIDQSLRSRSGEIAALVRASGSGLGDLPAGTLVDPEESFAQVLGPGGEVIDSTPQLRSEPVLEGAELEAAVAAPRTFERGGLARIDEPVRLLAAPVDAPGGEVVTVVGAALDDRDDALASLATVLLLGGPIALLLASLAGYGAAAAALGPVEAMRRRAAAISAARLGERLPLPAARDELRRLGETLNEMLGRLEAAIERERRFVDDASHELRTPLTLHKTELELALRHGGEGDELRAAVASAIEEVDRLIGLAEDLLVVARSHAGELALAREALATDELLAAVAERFRARAAESRRELILAGDALGIEGDRIRLEQALTNMVDNALRHGQGGVRLWARGDDDRVELHVSDSGPGFGPEFIDRAFERFSRADAARSRGGVGLGLAIVETIARAHGGRASAANDPRGGADVWIELPASRP